ncbi:P-loop containing nucleoside triphosphate hydrolase protein [Geopyxis carbonaria]|nr:P-loop containing nucleoside triphosphate hydrolase protein [Geopyxis carbonaria]
MSGAFNRTDSRADDGRPTVQELQGDNPLAQAAKRWWLREKPAKFNPELLKTEIYDVIEKENFGYKALLVLENLQFLEKFLWPNFSENASNYHVIMVALMINVKRREGVPIWDHLSSPPSNFSILFRRILSMGIDTTIPLSIRTHLLSFIVTAFQSLDSGLVRKECAALVSISIWNNLSSEDVRNEQLDKHTQTRKAWRAAGKRFDAADDTTKIRLRFERAWLYQMTLGFLNMIHGSSKSELSPKEVLVYCERFIELLTDLESQLPTRRYINTMLKDLNVLTAIKLSSLYANSDDGIIRDLYKLLEHFVYFSIDDITGDQLSQEDVRKIQNTRLAKLQRIAFKHFKEKLTILALANYGNIGQRDELTSHLTELTDEELFNLCKLLGIRTTYPKSVLFTVNREFLIEAILCTHERRKTFQDQTRAMTVLPNEKTLLETRMIGEGNYDGTRPLPLPKLNLQYLTVGDFLWRSFILYRHEAFYGIRRNIEDALKRLSPKIKYPSMETTFHGFAKMALIINRPSIMEVLPPKVGEEKPATVRAEVSLDLSRLSKDVREGWENLRSDDVVFLLAIKGVDDSDRMITNGGADRLNMAERYGIKSLRAADVVQILDSQGRPLRVSDQQVRRSDGQVRLHLHLDTDMYKLDSDNIKDGKPDIYDSINLIIRRKGRENNFRPILESIQELTQSDAPMPAWLQEVFLGYGDPAGATNLPNRPKTVDFRDTFIDWSHLVESFAGVEITPKDNTPEGCAPPYVISENFAMVEQSQPNKKRRRNHADAVTQTNTSLGVSTYKLPNMGPYPMDQLRKNTTRYTPTQVEAIRSGTNPGLTVIVGPPGTGKTDVATQIISNLYHNFPNQRTLLVAHSNQALNQLFEKITALDIDERHLLRLGHGEDGLATSNNFSKQGRVESFMDNRARFLAEVDRLAICLRAPGAHGDSCETAGYFNSVYVLPAWQKFETAITAAGLTADQTHQAYPFNEYFSNAPSPMFPNGCSAEDALEIAHGGYRHIKKIFSELEDIRPFELLRTPRDRQNYLLVKEARIIAMTSTHAAIKRRDITKLGFYYDNIVMEEAAQITEIETFIPLALQRPVNGELPLQRIVLCGDHYQNSPILQNIPLKQYANLDQSLFARFIRLNVPFINLDKQGRARPSIADLYAWRYKDLGHLPSLDQQPEYQIANAGFRHEFQFINVDDYKGVGEQEPTSHFVQNLGEAEYAVAIYQYMRLLGYPRDKVTILTPYVGQRALIRDVLNRRCAKNPIFGMPHIVTTVDKYQGEQNDYVILSLVRTKRVGYLRDIRRMTVALSRARLGMYVLGRKEVFSSCYELSEAFRRLLQSKCDKLELVTGEMFPTQRKPGDKVESTEMDSVEHIGQYVYEMTNTKLEAMKAARGGITVPAIMEDENEDEDIDAEGDEEEEEEAVMQDGEAME